ncbi:MAG: oligoendopeptidase F, partial [Planctomycetaceae bacterium]
MPETTYPLNWELDSLSAHPESDDFQQQFSALQRDLETLASVSESLPAVSSDEASVQAWIEFLKSFELTESRNQEIYALIACHAAADADNSAFQQWEARLAALDPLRQQIATNLEFAVQSADPDQLDQFLSADDWLNAVGFFIRELRLNSALRFPKDQETLAAELGVDGIHAWGRLYDRLSSALRISVMQRGELIEKSPGQVQFDTAERTVRENNFYAADKAWSSIADTCADSVNHIAGTRLTRCRRLGLSDHLVAPLRYNRMRRETLDTMWSVVTERKHVLVDYLRRKAQLLGLDALAWYDLQAPLPRGSDNEPELDYETACNLVIQTFDGFSTEFGDFAR